MQPTAVVSTDRLRRWATWLGVAVVILGLAGLALDATNVVPWTSLGGYTPRMVPNGALGLAALGFAIVGLARAGRPWERVAALSLLVVPFALGLGTVVE